jgi:hypothetical protein
MKEMIDLAADKATPRILLNSNKKQFLIEGESYPENAISFYEPVINWVKEYLKSSEEGIELAVKLLYINTSSTKALLVLFDLIEEYHEKGKDSRILWLYDEGNEISREIGIDLKDGLNLPFMIQQI